MRFKLAKLKGKMNAGNFSGYTRLIFFFENLNIANRAVLVSVVSHL